MRIKSYSTLFSFFLCFFFPSSELLQKDFIEMKYTGESSKPYPVIMFGLPGSLDTENVKFYVHKFEISKKGLDEIRHVTENRQDILRDTVLESTFQVSFVGDGESTIFVTTYLSRVREIFQISLLQFQNDPSSQTRLKKQLDNIISRMEIDNQFKVDKRKYD